MLVFIQMKPPKNEFIAPIRERAVRDVRKSGFNVT